MSNNIDFLTEWGSETLVSLLERNRHEEAKGITFIYSNEKEQFLSYKELYRRAVTALFHLQQNKIKPGNEVVLVLEDNQDFIILFWACLLGKIIPVPLPAGNRDDHKDKINTVWNVLTHPWLITTSAYYKKLQEYNESNPAIALKELEERYINNSTLLAGNEEGRVVYVLPVHLGYIQFSSGSTGEPKGVRLTHRNLVANVKDIISRSEITENDRSLSWMPLSHDMGLICFHLTAVGAAINQYIMDTSLFIRNPVLWIEKTSRHRITQLYSPNFGYHYFLTALENYTPGAWDLSPVRIIYNGAEPIAHELCEQFLSRLSLYGLSKQAMFPGYGLAEASVAVALPHVNDPLNIYYLAKHKLGAGDSITLCAPGEGVAFVQTGLPLDHCAVRICSVDDEVYEDEVIGHIQLKGDNVTDGYYNNESATRAVFTADGWLRTGDMGFMQEGKLIITGRAKNIIIINGQNHYPQDIERLVSKFFEPFDLGKVVACGIKGQEKESEQLLVFLLYKGKLNEFVPYVHGIKELLAEKMGLLVQAVLPVRRIPKTTSGKVQHFKLVELYRTGEYDEVVNQLDALCSAAGQPVDQQRSPEEQLIILCEQVLGKNAVEPDTGFFAAGLTSLAAVQLVNAIRQQMQVQLAVNDLFIHSSVNQLAAFIGRSKGVEWKPLQPVEEQEHYVPAAIQKRFWLLNRLDEQATAWHLSSAYAIEGDLDVPSFKAAFKTVLTQYEALRTTFVEVNGELRQKVNEPAAVFEKAFRYIDLRHDAFAAGNLSFYANEEAYRLFDLQNGPLIRCSFLHIQDNRFLFVFSIHHIIADGWSVSVLINQLRLAYTSYRQGLALPETAVTFQYRDFAALRSRQLPLDEMQKHRQYWKEQLKGELTTLELPFAKARSSIQTFTGRAITQKLPESLSRRLVQFAREREVTPFMILSAALRVLLYRYTGQHDLIIGTDTAGRTHPGLENQLGCFLNTLPLRSPVSQHESFFSLLTREKITVLQALDHQEYPFDSMIEDLDLRKEFSRTPLFDVLLLFQNMERSYSFEGLDEQLTIRPMEIPVRSALVDLVVEFYYEGATLAVNLTWNDGLFDAAPIERMAEHLVRLLQLCIEQPETPVAAFNFLSEGEQQTIQRFSCGEQRAPVFNSLLNAINKQVIQNGKAIAVCCEHRRLTYEELNYRANQLARYLIQHQQVGRGQRIGLMKERSEQLIISLLAILKTGATYVPVEPDYPAERIRFILEDGNCRLLVTDEASLQQHSNLPFTVVLTNKIAFEWYAFDTGNPGVDTSGDDVAYILYTSGSTGYPKGVMIEQRSVCDYVETFMEYFKLSPADKVIQQSSLSFDISVEEIFSTLCAGAQLLIVKNGGRDIEELVTVIEEEQATILSTTPLVINELNKKAGRLHSLRVLISGGDSLKPSYIDELTGIVPVYNTYGPTETTVCVTYQPVNDAGELSVIGKPLPNHELLILDDQLKIVPVGIAGQICIAGAGLAKGYVNSALEAAVFTEHPWKKGERLYLTGDRGLWQEDGTIRFCGRKDTQLKWRGYRIETREVEETILRFAGIKDVLVTIAGKRQRLTAYLAAAIAIDTEELKLFVSRQLPSYMVPASVVLLDEFPVTTSGKVDARRLPDPDLFGISSGDAYAAPANDWEKKVLHIWQQVLKTDAVGVLDNFFELGGNSLQATRILTRIQQELSVQLSLRDILTHPTIRAIARFLPDVQQNDHGYIAITEKKQYYPVSLGQRRLWMLQQLESGEPAYNLSWSFTIKGKQVSWYFSLAMEALVKRHEALRTSFTAIDGNPYQCVEDFRPGYFTLTVIDIQAAPGSWKKLVRDEARLTFDLAQGPLFRVKLYQTGAEEFRVGFTIHHIITDGWSMEIIWQELNELMNACCNETILVQDPFRITYKDYAAWQEGYTHSSSIAGHEAYWVKQFSDGVPVLELPAQRLAQQVTGKGKTLHFRLADELAEGIRMLAGKQEVTVFTVYLALLKVLLFKYTGQQDMVIATPVANRGFKELENQVGYYLNILPLRTSFTAAESFATVVQKVKQTVWDAWEHQEYPVEQLVEKIGLQGGLQHPLFDIILVMQNFDHRKKEHNQVQQFSCLHEVEEVDNETSIGKLLIELNEFKQYQTLKIRYDAGLFSEEQVRTFALHFERLGKQLIQSIHQPVNRHSLLSEKEKTHLLTRFGTTGVIEYPKETIVSLFERAVAAYPNRVAIVVNDQSFTYASINRLANCLAAQLTNTGKTGAGKLIALLLQRSEKLIISMLAVLKSGAAYIPIDTDYPAERVQTILTDSGAGLIITESRLLPACDITAGVIDWDNRHAWMPQADIINEPADSSPEDVAYVMYTSGSTGKPKGVLITHAALTDYVHTFTAYYSLTAQDRVIQQSSPAFDVSVEEIFPALCAGATILVMPEGGRNVDQLVNGMEREQATLLSTTPLLVAELNRQPQRLGHLRILISGGDRLKAGHVDQLTGKVKVYNSYGPTEATVCVTYHAVVTPQDVVSIGKPIINHRIYILDEHDNLQPAGIPGELCIAGAGLAKGYLGLPHETQKRFVDNPFEPGTKMYRTGDRCLWRSDGTVEFLGRIDSQFKINGYRVEREEIEKALLQYNGIAEAAVVAGKVNGDAVEVKAFFRAGKPVDQPDLRTWLSQQLPYYMVPARCVQVDHFPLTPNGKIDYAALSSFEISEYENPETIWEQQLAKIWAVVLEKESISRNDNFFSLGGNSIRATRLVNRLQEQFNSRLQLKDVFLHPVLHEQAYALKRAATGYLQRIQPIEDRDSYDISHAQKRIWILNQLEQGQHAYHIFIAYRIEGELDIALLGTCFNELITRHESLRTAFELAEGKLQQRVYAAADISFDIAYVDARHSAHDEQAIAALAKEEQGKPFSLDACPLFRVKLIQCGATEFVLLLTLHHIISDGWSVTVLAQELNALYAAGSRGESNPLPSLTIQYRDYAYYINEQIASKAFAIHEQYWLNQFEQEIPVLELPLDFPRPVVKTANGNSCRLLLKEKLVEQLTQLAETCNASLFMVMLAGLKALLYRYTGQHDIVIGTPVSGRSTGNLENQVGCYVNTLAIRTGLSGHDTFVELLQTVKQNVLNAFEHQLYPFDSLVEALYRERDLSRSPLFDVMLAMQTISGGMPAVRETTGITVKPLHTASASSKFDLTVYVFEAGKSLELVLEYNTDLFTEERVGNLLQHYNNILEQATDQPAVPVKQLDFLASYEKIYLLERFNAPGLRLFSYHSSVVDLVERQVAERAAHAAVLYKEQVVTYKSLNDLANRVACHLMAAFGTGRGDLVGILVDRSAQMVAALLGILKTGAAYVPIDPAYPENRARYIIRDSAVKVVLTEEKYQHFFDDTVTCVLLSDIPVQVTEQVKNPLVYKRSNDTAYVIYTSGSTGRPKGIPITHKNLAAFISWAKMEFARDAADIIYASTSYCFDLSVFEMLYPLATGKTLRVLPSGLQIEEYLLTDKNILINTVPAVVEHLVNNKADFSNVRSINMAGEPVFAGLKAKLDLRNITYRNLYGPSEDTTYSTCYVFREEDVLIPIGKPVSFDRIYIVDEHLNLLPPGVTGEICIAGEGLAQGYLNMPELTREKFVDNPFYRGDTLYRTGDLGKWLPGGDLEFVGRKDDQLKIRGYRIEPGEIEKVFSQVDGIEKVVLLCAGQGAEKQLLAYYTATRPVGKDEVVTHLENYLPGYMIPYAIVQLDAFPLTPNGKIDRKALLQYDRAHQTISYVAPVTRTEKALATIWNEVLGTEQTGTNDNFFGAGGNSLKAAQLLSRINKAFTIQLQLRDIFIHATIGKLAKLIEGSSTGILQQVMVQEEQEHYAPTHMQRRLWILDQLEKGSTPYNMYSVYCFTGVLDIAALSKAYYLLAARHESLRTSFRLINNEVRQLVLPVEAIDIAVDYEDCRAVAYPEAEALNKACAQSRFVFNLARGPLVNLKLLQFGESRYYFSVCMHHIISDGWSMNVIMNEIIHLYESVCSGTEITLPALSIQYKDFSTWHLQQLHTGQFAGQKQFWLTNLAGEIQPLELPGTQPRPAVKTHHGSEYAITLDKTAKASLATLAGRYDATLFMLLVASFKALLYRYTGQEDILLGMPAAGRWHTDLENQVGFYVNTLVIRTAVTGSDSFTGLLEKVKKSIVGALDNQHYPFDQLLEEVHVKRDVSRSPLFDIMVIFQDGVEDKQQGKQLSELQFEEVALPAEVSKFDLSLTFQSIDEGLIIKAAYNRDIFSRWRIVQLLEHYQELINRIPEDPAKPIDHINYITGNERQLLLDFTKQEEVVPPVLTVTQAFEQQAAKTPFAAAVIFNDKVLTYRQLNEAANKVAWLLRTKHHIKANTLVGIMMERSEQLVIGILGILKSGAAYVPVDPAYPEARRKYIIEQSRLTVLLTEECFCDIIGHTVCCNINEAMQGNQPVHNLPVSISTGDLAYVMYTSGTTGNPKGVQVEHHSVMNLSAWLQELIYEKHEHPLTVLLNASVSFDSSVKQLFPPLLTGSALVLVTEETHKNPKALVKELATQQVDVWDITPGYLTQVLKLLHSRFHFPAYTLAGGEALPVATVKRYYELLGNSSTLINVYGVTEATVDSAYAVTTTDTTGSFNIGKPLRGTGIYILDSNKQLVPVGFAGELCISGEGVARGYLYDDELTKQKFITHPFGNGLLYCTGDAAKWLPDGTIDFIGRLDKQVKVNGYRIEPAEIEHTLLLCEWVQDACVTALKNQQGDVQLAAYYVSAAAQQPAVIKAWLESRLPRYMIPAWLLPLDELPLNEHGKINKAALPDPRLGSLRNRDVFEEAGTAVERELAAWWEAILEYKNPGINDNFFDIGGNSLKVIQLYNRIQENYPDRLEIHQLFSNPTIKQMALLLSAGRPLLMEEKKEIELIEL